MNKRNILSALIVLSILGFFTSRTNAQTAPIESLGDPNISSPDPVDESIVQGNGSKPGQNSTGAHVNTFTGDAWATSTDFNYKRNGYPLKYERYFHNGITSPFGELGQGWMSNYDICLFAPMPNSGGDHALLVLPHQTWRFPTNDGGNTFNTPPGCFYQLQTVTGSSPTTYVLTDKFGNTSKFSVLSGGEPNVARLIEIDDLNGNKAILTYQAFYYFAQIDLVVATCDLSDILSGPVTIWGASSLRLSNVNGNNWSASFDYYDNTSAPITIYNNGTTYCNTQGTPNPRYLVLENNNFFGNRLKSVTNNSTGEVIAFDSGSQAGPITQVSRSPSGLNASYQYYSYTSNLTGSNPSTIVTLQKVIDPLSPVGYRNLNYVSETSPNGINNPVRQIINSMGEVMYSYDYSNDWAGNKLTGTSGPNGLIETDVYSGATSQMVQKRFVVDGHLYNNSYTWDQNNLLTNFVDGNNHAVSMAYDALGNMIFRQDAEGALKGYSQSVSFNSISRPVTSTDNNNAGRSYGYDSYGNLTSVDEPLSDGVTYTYDINHTTGTLNSKTVQDANYNVTTYNYDSNGNLSSVNEPGGINTTYSYNNLNQLSYVIDPLSQRTNYPYNTQNFLQSVQYADGTSEGYSYNSDGAVTQFTDRKGTITTYALDSEDRTTDVYAGNASGYLPQHTHYQLDALGNQTSITDNKNQTTNFVYNEQNLVKSSSDPIGVGYTDIYDGALNIHSVRDGRGITKTMSYYANDLLQSVQFSDGTPSLSYMYDGNANRIIMTDGIGTKKYSYDALNRPITVTDTARNFTLSYTYDPVGNRLSSQNNLVPGTVYYGYNSNNLMQAVTDVDGMATSFTYDAMKHPANVYLPNGASVTYSYVLTNHRLQSIQNLNSKSEIFSSYNYGYDGAGNVTIVSDLAGSTTFAYDNLYQLTSATYPGPQSLASYFYDQAGNRTSLLQNGVTQTYGYNSGNELTSGPNGSVSNDKAGNVTLNGSTNYSWNASNQLVRVSPPAGGVTATFLYDGDGHRVRKITSNGTINYFYDGNSVVLETDGSGNVLKSYNPGISFTDQQKNKYFYLQNGHGDVVGLLDSKQNLVQSYNYDAFGKTLGDSKDSNHFRYVGYGFVYSDDDIGLQYMWNRWYDPALGRFVSRDPKGFEGKDENFYNYSKNNPLSFFDLTGLDYTSTQFAAGFIFGFTLGHVEDSTGSYFTLGIGFMTPGFGFSETKSDGTIFFGQSSQTEAQFGLPLGVAFAKSWQQNLDDPNYNNSNLDNVDDYNFCDEGGFAIMPGASLTVQYTFGNPQDNFTSVFDDTTDWGTVLYNADLGTYTYIDANGNSFQTTGP